MNAAIIFLILTALMVTGMPVSIALGLTVLSFLFGFTDVPLESVALSREARRIADNPLSQWVYCGRNDSFGQIAFALRSLEAESGAMVGRIADSARQLNEDVGELAAAVDCSRGASVQQPARGRWTSCCRGWPRTSPSACP